MNRRRTVRNSAAVLGALALVSFGGPAALGEAGSSGDVKVVNTETVQVYMDAAGKVDTKRVYEQLTMTGHGRVDLLNPVSTAGLRNLDGFSQLTTKDGDQVVRTTVDGVKKTRSVSNYTEKLPLKVTTRYTLDGKSVKPGDVVGKSGKLEVSFTVQNLTGKTQTVTYPDGKGGTVAKQADVVVPIVGSLTTVAPPGFSNVKSGEANMAGDGQGGTKLSFTMTLFPPIGQPSATFGYTANIKDGVVPSVEVSALPVNPLGSPTFKSAASSYQGGADTGAQLTDGATQIDTNLLKIGDGASTLVAGLLKLDKGADQLSDGLNAGLPDVRKLAGGADLVADGNGTLKSGAGQLKNGAGQLKNGAGQLADGTGKALKGSKTLTAGLKQISGGLGELDGKLPAAGDGITQLKAGVDQLIAGMGDAKDPATLIGGLAALHSGLTALQTGSGDLKNGLGQLRGDAAQGKGLAYAKAGVDQIVSGIKAGAGDLDPASADALAGAIGSLKGYCAAQPTPTVVAQCNGTVDAIVSKVNSADPASLKSKLTGLQTKLGQALVGLGQVSDGLGTAITALDTQLIPGAGQINGGLGSALTGVGKLQSGAGAVNGGLLQLQAGLVTLATGVGAAVDGVGQLAAGSNQAYGGSSALTTGLGKLDAGATKLSDGSIRLSDGTIKLADGTIKLADGSRQVAGGNATLLTKLIAAADGSMQISDGLGTASKKAPALPKGAKKLSAQGTTKLIGAGESTTRTYAENVALIKAGAERAETSDMAYGAPAGATGITAYQYKIQGLDGEGRHNAVCAAGGVAVLGAAGGLIFLRRRFLV